jgi:hypothetical protein
MLLATAAIVAAALYLRDLLGELFLLALLVQLAHALI